MAVFTDDAMLLRYTDPAWRRPSPAAIGAARQVLPTIATDILALPESALARDSAWIGGGEGDGVRYAMYRVQERQHRRCPPGGRGLPRSSTPGGAVNPTLKMPGGRLGAGRPHS